MEKKHKTYEVIYCDGATGFCNVIETNSLKVVESIVDDEGRGYTNEVTVWDYRIHDFIFYKRCLCYKPEIDMVHSIGRDFRTKTRKWKE